MKTIAELQQEIRSIRKELESLDGRLDAIDAELLNFKEVASDSSEYKRIYEIAKTMPLIKHPIIKENIATKNNYFGILLMIATVDDSLNEDQLLFLQRMVLADVNNSRLDYYLGSLGAIQRENVLYKMDGVIKAKLSEQLLLDMIILANLSHTVSRNSYEIIVSIAALVKKGKTSLSMISKVASAILRQDISDLVLEHKEIDDMDSRFGYYLVEIKGWKECASHQGKEISKTAFFHMSEKEEYGNNWYYYRD